MVAATEENQFSALEGLTEVVDPGWAERAGDLWKDSFPYHLLHTKGSTRAIGTPRLNVPVFPGMIGPYVVELELGRGGMGVVYVARNPVLDRLVAIKVLRGGQHAGADALERFEREARALARLRHPNIVAIHGYGSADDHPYIVMDLVEGEGLNVVLERDGPLDPMRAARLTAALADAIEHAHAGRILHRDVKPSNVLLTPAGEPVLTDFGLAKDVGDHDGVTGTGQAVGTPAYMAPEQAEGGAVGTECDVYALGATLYAMLTGEAPFGGTTAISILHQVIEDEPPRPRELRPELDPDLETICLKCMAKDPGQRYSSAQALADDLRRYLDGQSIAARAPTLRERFSRWARKEQNKITLLIWGLALLTAVAIGASTWAVRAQAKLAVREAEAWRNGGEAKRLAVQTESRRAAALALAALEAEVAPANRVERAQLALVALRAAEHWRVTAPNEASRRRAEQTILQAAQILANLDETEDPASPVGLCYWR